MARYNKLLIHRYLSQNQPELIEHAKNRQTGTSTGLALISIAKALFSPNIPVKAIDHLNTNNADRFLFKKIQEFVELLDLHNIKFNKTDLTITYVGCIDLSDEEVELLEQISSNSKLREIIMKVYN